MTDYKLVPVDAVRRAARILGSQGFDVWDQLASELDGILAAPDVQGEPVAVMYEDGSLLSKAACGVNFEICCKVQTPLYTAPQPAEQQPFEWPLLDAPALIGGVVVGKGCSTGTVVAIAKRKHQYAVETSPEEHARREKAFKDVLAQIHEGINQSGPEHMPGENAPDVEALVEALEQIVSGSHGGRYEVEQLKRIASTALAAHRKGGGA